MDADRRNVLIVERPSPLRDAFARALESQGAKATVVNDGIEALGRARELSPGTVVLGSDVGAPGRDAVCRILHRTLGSARIVLFTDGPKAALEPTVIGASEVLARSGHPDVLARAALGEARAEDAAVNEGEARTSASVTVPALRLPELMTALYGAGLSGRLVLSAEHVEREVTLRAGMPVHGRSSVFFERFGMVATRRYDINPGAIDRALDHSRGRGIRLGQAMLERGDIDGLTLYRILAAQLLELLSAAFNGAEVRARLYPLSEGAAREPVVRLHPLTAIAAAVSELPKDVPARTLNLLGERYISAGRALEQSRSFLADLGVNDPGGLAKGKVREARERLSAAFGGDAKAQDGKGLNADVILLALLRAGALRVVISPPGASMRPPGASIRPPVAPVRPTSFHPTTAGAGFDAMSLVQALERASESPLTESAFADIGDGAFPIDAAMRGYLFDARPPELARGLALEGPGVEVVDDARVAKLLGLYLTQENAAPHALLGVAKSADGDALKQAHLSLLESIDPAPLGEPAHNALTRFAFAEVRRRVDDAFDATLETMPLDNAVILAPSLPPHVTGVPGVSHRPGASLAAFVESLPPGPSIAVSSSSDAPQGPPSLPNVSFDPTKPLPSQGRVPSRAPAMINAQQLELIERYLLRNQWDLVLQALTDTAKNGELSPPLALIFALARKELAGAQSSSEADQLAIRAMADLLGVSPESTTAIVVAKRMLRRNPQAWRSAPAPPARISFFIILAAAAGFSLIGYMVSKFFGL